MLFAASPASAAPSGKKRQVYSRFTCNLPPRCGTQVVPFFLDDQIVTFDITVIVFVHYWCYIIPHWDFYTYYKRRNCICARVHSASLHNHFIVAKIFQIIIFFFSVAHDICLSIRNTILISQRLAGFVASAPTWCGVAGGLQVVRGSRPASFSWFLSNNGFNSGWLWMRGHSRLDGARFQRAAEPRCSFIIISRLEVAGNTLRCR